MAGKGKGVTEFEQIADAAKNMALERRGLVQDYVGDVPARSVRRTTADKAQQFLPDFYARGMATGPVGLAYWTQLLQERGPKGMVQQGKELMRLMNDPRHWATPITASSPAQQRQTSLLRLQGQHSSVKPPTDTGGTDGAAP